jgi:hypothetical protein
MCIFIHVRMYIYLCICIYMQVYVCIHIYVYISNTIISITERLDSPTSEDSDVEDLNAKSNGSLSLSKSMLMSEKLRSIDIVEDNVNSGASKKGIYTYMCIYICMNVCMYVYTYIYVCIYI